MGSALLSLLSLANAFRILSTSSSGGGADKSREVCAIVAASMFATNWSHCPSVGVVFGSAIASQAKAIALVYSGIFLAQNIET